MSGTTNEGDTALRLDRLWLTYGDVTAVRDLSLSLARGEFLTLLAPSGSGKTLVLRPGVLLFDEPLSALDLSLT